jgi:hypothetical protein
MEKSIKCKKDAFCNVDKKLTECEKSTRIKIMYTIESVVQAPVYVHPIPVLQMWAVRSSAYKNLAFNNSNENGFANDSGCAVTAFVRSSTWDRGFESQSRH